MGVPGGGGLEFLAARQALKVFVLSVRLSQIEGAHT
jgi:hypothetical protein